MKGIYILLTLLKKSKIIRLVDMEVVLKQILVK